MYLKNIKKENIITDIYFKKYIFKLSIYEQHLYKITLFVIVCVL